MRRTGIRRTEYKWWARLHFRLLGVWPERVVNERLAEDSLRQYAARRGVKR